MSANIEKGEFELYLMSYCEDHGLTREEALKHQMVQAVKEYYDNRD